MAPRDPSPFALNIACKGRQSWVCSHFIDKKPEANRWMNYTEVPTWHMLVADLLMQGRAGGTFSHSS